MKDYKFISYLKISIDSHFVGTDSGLFGVLSQKLLDLSF